ncbi:MAG: hypothetical protein IKR64_00130 [Treponema sp.]|nr:hypothetical protein [Treponema sp.]
MNKRQKAAIIFNIIIFVFTLFATISMLVGFQFMGKLMVLSEKNYMAFKYFTVDSNVFAGLLALAYIIYKLSPKGKTTLQLPKVFYILKLAATTGVTLTMMVTVFFLAPTSHGNFLHYFTNSNFFMHLITPLFCIISFIFFEEYRPQKFLLSLAGIIPMMLYSFYYIPNILFHLENGQVPKSRDWYGFLQGGLNTVWFVLPLLYLITWIFAIGLWALNKKVSVKK